MGGNSIEGLPKEQVTNLIKACQGTVNMALADDYYGCAAFRAYQANKLQGGAGEPRLTQMVQGGVAPVLAQSTPARQPPPPQSQQQQQQPPTLERKNSVSGPVITLTLAPPLGMSFFGTKGTRTGGAARLPYTHGTAAACFASPLFQHKGVHPLQLKHTSAFLMCVARVLCTHV